MRSQIFDMEQASRNVVDGMSLFQAADGFLDGTAKALQRMKMLAVQAANGTYDEVDRDAIQLDIARLTSEINMKATFADFNGIKLFDGSNVGFYEYD
jgi:flagellin